MTKRQAKKIVKNQIIRCKSEIDGPEDIVTGGCTDYPEPVYRMALHKLRRALDREQRGGSLSRCIELYRHINLARAGLPRHA